MTFSPSSRIRLAIIGLGSRARHHIRHFAAIPEVEIVEIVDPDKRTHRAQARLVETLTGRKVTVFTDPRRVFDDRTIDAISVVTPNHWHALLTIWACESGKDALIEKPGSHNLGEAQLAVAAASRHSRIMQYCLSRRGMGGYAGVAEFVRSGRAGRLLSASAISHRPRPNIGFQPAIPVPETLDFDLWRGPVNLPASYHNHLHETNWHWFWAYGDGEIGAQGVHLLDVACWVAGDIGYPRLVQAIGGRYGVPDQGETPNTMLARFEYDGFEIYFESRGLAVDAFPGWVPTHANGAKMIGNVFDLEGGRIVDTTFYPGDGGAPLSIPTTGRGPDDLHSPVIFRNFIDCIRTRRASDLYADISTTHHAAALAHYANTSYRLGSEVSFATPPAPMAAHSGALTRWSTLRRHLEDQNIPIETSSYRLGRPIAIDPATGQALGDVEAERLLRASFRPPFCPASTLTHYQR